MLGRGEKNGAKRNSNELLGALVFSFLHVPSILKQILRTGTKAEQPKRVRDHMLLINTLSLVGLFLCFAYVGLYLLHFGPAFAISDSLAAICYLSNFYWSRRGIIALQPRILLAAANYQIIAGTIILGPRSDLFLYGTLLSFGCHFLLGKSSSLEKWFWSFLSFGVYLFGFFAKETFEFAFLMQPHLPEWYPWTSRVGSFFICLIVMRLVIDAKDSSLAELEHGKELMDQAQKIASFGSSHIDLNSGSITWSDELFRIHGLPLAEGPEDLFCLERVHPEDRPSLAEKSKHLSSLSFPQEFEYRILKGGETIYLRVLLDTERDQDGRISGIHGACQDISHDKIAEQALKDQQSKMVAASKLSALGEMAGGIAHEINNPLTIITGKTRQIRMRLKSGVDLSILLKDIDLIESTAFRIAKIVRGMQSFSRDGTKDPPTEVPFSSILEDTLSLCQDRFKSNEVKLIVKNSMEDRQILSRPIQISQVLINLINNAFDAIENLPAEEKWIQVSTACRTERLIIKISNGGPKILDSVIENMMKPFFTTKPPGKGTGLGLAISRGIIADHGGQMYVDAQESFTTFVIELDLHPGAESPLLKSA